MDGAQVFGRHNIFVLDIELVAGLAVGDGVASAADLGAGASVGRGVHLVEREIAFAGNGHTEGAVAEHFDSHQLAVRAADIFVDYGLMDGRHLVEVEFAGEHHHIGILRIVAECGGVAHTELRGDVHLHIAAAGIEDCGHIRGDDGGDAGGGHGVDDGAHLGHILVVDDGVDGEVGFHTVFVADRGNAAEVVEGEVHAGTGTHIQAFHAEVHGVGSGVYSSPQTLVRAYGRHYLKILSVHSYGLRMISNSPGNGGRGYFTSTLRAKSATFTMYSPAGSAMVRVAAFTWPEKTSLPSRE